MKEPNKRTYNSSGSQTNSTAVYWNQGNNAPNTHFNGEEGKNLFADAQSRVLETSRSRSRGYIRSQSTDGYSVDSSDEVRKQVNEFENRQRYITTILERYYSHPSNRQRSLPLRVREQLLNAVASDKEDHRRRMGSIGAPVAAEDSTSEVSSAVSGHRSEVPDRVSDPRATPDSSPYYDEDKGTSLRSRTRPGSGKKKSRFFRSASMRSLKRWMSKLRGRGKASIADKKGATSAGAVSPISDAVLTNGLVDSTAFEQSGAGFRRNSTNFHPPEQSDCVDGALSSGRTRVKNFPASVRTTTDIPTPALCGIVNHGNTCYINAVLQCLSNTDLLAEYFLSGQYWTDLRNNLRNADRYGSQGNVTLALARFLKALWFNSYTPDVSSNFKSIMERYSEQYRGNQQQDAQEFFYWLADRVHEDLNVAVKRRYKLHKSRSKNEDELAAAAMEKHLEAHNSFISSRFHGLFLSTVTCPVCRKQSMKPDPFMCISLPVSQCTKRPLFVVVVFINRQPRQVRFGLNADVTATFIEVKKCLADATDLAVDQLLLCEMNDFGLQTTMADHHEVMSLGRTKCIWAFEIPLSIRLPVATLDEELFLVVGNQLASNSGSGPRFGSPVALRVSREVTYGDLFRALFFAMRPQFKPHVALHELPPSSFRIRIIDDFHPLVFIPNDVSLPLFTQAVDNALMHMTSSGLPPSLLHLKLMLEWQRDAKERYFTQTEERIVDHVSAQDLRDQEEHPEVQSLHDCLAEYTRPEACQWYCPDCRHRQDSAAKRIVLYWLPDVLVLHLKRFKQLSSGQLVKLDATVWFPVSDLDLSDYTHQSISRSQRKQQRTTQSYRTKNGELYIDTRPSQNLYDLYAVCNHSGHSPHSGHYTAFCRNPVNGRWYCFDDQSVTPIRERDLVTNGAYLLFYERRQLRKGSEGHNSAESGFVDHWFFRIYSSHLLEQQQKSSRSSKDAYDGEENGTGLPYGAADHVDPNGHPTSPQLNSVPESLSSQTSNNACGNASRGQDTGYRDDCAGISSRKSTGDKLSDYPSAKSENGQVITVDLPDFVRVLPVECEDTPTLHEESTITMESCKGGSSQDGTTSTSGNHRAAIDYGAPNEQRGSTNARTGVQSGQRAVALRANIVVDGAQKRATVTANGAAAASDTPGDSIERKLQTCSVVETDL